MAVSVHRGRGGWLVLALLGLCLLAAGCVSYPISKSLREQAKTTQAAGFVAVAHNADAYKGRMVIWGGKILKTVNDTNGGAVFVLQAPLDSEQRPLSTKLSQGRFMLRSAAFLDPEVYSAGAMLTIAGPLAGAETQTIDQTTYTYPVVSVLQVYFWRTDGLVYMAPPPWGWGWYGPYYGPYYGGFYYYPRYYYGPHFHGGFHDHH